MQLRAEASERAHLRGIVAETEGRLLDERVPGGIVAFLDDDDLWAPDKIASQVAALGESRGAAWSATGAVDVDSQLRIVRASRVARDFGSLPKLLRGNEIPGGGSVVMAERDLLLELGGFNESLSVIED